MNTTGMAGAWAPATAPPLGDVQHLWLGLEMPDTNKLLKLQRASGHYQARRAEMKYRGARRLPRASVSFETIVAQIRRFTCARALESRLRPMMRPVTVFAVLWTATGKQDPDAWYLPTKAAVDGLVDAKVFLSDRFDVANGSGTVAKVYETPRTIGWPIAPAIKPTPGLALYLVEWGTGS